MDFFQAQENARRRSGLLVFYFAAAVAMIVAVIYTVAVLVFTVREGPEGISPVQFWRPDVLAIVAPATVGLIFIGSLMKSAALRSGGGVVARSVGGRKLEPGTADPKHRRLMNVVEEMAIASGVRVPEVYVLPEAGINAFAAGYSPDDAAIAVTEGALDTLSRDELQGVIAHEFSHILNGDMRLNIRLIGLLFGILLIAIIGRGVTQSLRFSRMSSGRGSRDNSGGIVLALFLFGIALLIVGYIGVFFGRLIQAAVSRQREFLADAAAVQFTRNPAGIGGALKRIGAQADGSRVLDTHAAETSHLFFANALEGSAFNLFATHPPLPERIRAIEPNWDGRFPKPVQAAAGAARSSASDFRARVEAARARTAQPPPLTPAHFIAAVAGAAVADPVRGTDALAEIPESLREAARDPVRARAILLALLAPPTKDNEVLARQREAITAALDPAERLAGVPLFPGVAALAARARLPLVDLALPALRMAAPGKTASLLSAIDALIAADKEVSLFEFAVRHVVQRALQPSANPAARAGDYVYAFRPLAGEFGLVLSAIAHVGASEPGAAAAAFRVGASAVPALRDQVRMLDKASCLAPDELGRALRLLERAAPPIKRAVIEAMAQTATADGIIRESEVELVRAVAAALDVPAPPMAA